jgi:hypothetical protein
MIPTDPGCRIKDPLSSVQGTSMLRLKSFPSAVEAPQVGITLIMRHAFKSRIINILQRQLLRDKNFNVILRILLFLSHLRPIYALFCPFICNSEAC